MFVPLFLHYVGLLARPVFYISSFLETHRDEYYDRLLAVSREGDWTGWTRFFLQAVQILAEENLARTRKILDLYQGMKTIVVDATHSQYAIRALDFFFSNPILSASFFSRKSGIPGPTSKRMVRLLKERGVLVEIREGSGSRPAILGFRDLLNAAEGKEVF
jgi:Fic family protein